MPKQRDPRQDEAFILWEGGKRSPKEIADILGVPPNRVRYWKSADGWEEGKSAKALAKNKSVSKTASVSKNISNEFIGSRSFTNATFEGIFFKDLSDDERVLLDVDRDKYKIITAQIDRLTIQEMRLLQQVADIETAHSMPLETIKHSKGISRGENEDLTETIFVSKDKRIVELLKELASVQRMKATAVSILHRMQVEDARHGLAVNESVESAKQHSLSTLEAFNSSLGEAQERKAALSDDSSSI